MRILIVSLNFAPEQTGTGKTMAGRARALAAAGHEVQVIAGFPHFPQWRVHRGYRRRPWMHERIDGVEILRTWHSVPRRSHAVGRALIEATFSASSLFGLVARRPDVVFGVFPILADGVAAALLARRFRVPLGIFVQDLSARSAAQSGMRGARPLARPAGAVEGWLLRRAHAVAIITEGFRPPILSYDVSPERVHLVPDWTPVREPTRPSAEVRRRLGLPLDRTLALHSGNMGNKQGLENLVEAARLARDAGDETLFVLVGDGNQREALVALARRYSLDNVRFLPLQDDDLYPSVLGAADILVLNQRGSVVDMSFPSKLAAYLSAGRPVVAAAHAESETARELRLSGGGIIVAPDDPGELLDGIRGLARDRAEGERLGRAGQAHARRRWSDDRLRSGLETFVATTAGTHERPHAGVAR